MANDAPKPEQKKDGGKPTHIRVRVRARGQAGFRRAGFAFGQEPRDIPLADLDEARLKAIQAEAALVTELVRIEA